MATYILIHGAWHGSWCWELIVPLLEAQGHTVVAPDLPGMGQDNTHLSEVTVDTWLSFLKRLIQAQNEKVILLGHSRAGLQLSQLAEDIPDCIAGLIYLAAFLVPHGGTLSGTLQAHPDESSRPPDLHFSNDRTISTVSENAITQTFYNTTEKKLQDKAKARLCAEPMLSFKTPIWISEARFGEIPRAYIECLQDKAIPIALQRKMVSDLPCVDIASLDCDHSPFYSAPQALAKSILSLSKHFN